MSDVTTIPATSDGNTSDAVTSEHAVEYESYTNPDAATEGQQNPGQGDAVKQLDQGGSQDSQVDPVVTEQPKISRTQKRIGQLTARLRDAERKIERFKQSADTGSSNEELDPYDYASDQEYMAAVTKQAVQQTQATFSQNMAQEAAHEMATAANEIWGTRCEDVKQTIPDFEAVVKTDDQIFSNTMANIMYQQDLGPQMAYYLSKKENHTESKEIASLDPMGQAMAMGALSQKLKLPTPKLVSGAPAPVPTVAATKAGNADRPDGQDFDAYERWHKNQPD